MTETQAIYQMQAVADRTTVQVSRCLECGRRARMLDGLCLTCWVARERADDAYVARWEEQEDARFENDAVIGGWPY